MPNRQPPHAKLLGEVEAVSRTVGLVRQDSFSAGQIEVARQDLNGSVSHQLLERADIGAVLEHIDGKGVAEPVRVDMHPAVLAEPVAHTLDRTFAEWKTVMGEKEMPVLSMRRSLKVEFYVNGRINARLDGWRLYKRGAAEIAHRISVEIHVTVVPFKNAFQSAN